MPVSRYKQQPTFFKMALLNEYLSMPSLPFAVLVRGRWGSGKTWFVKQFMQVYPNYDYCYISLFGLTDIEQINKSIDSLDISLASLANPLPHPASGLHSGEGGRRAASAAGSVLKEALPSFEQPADAEIIFQAASQNNMVFIFDDFERNSIGDHILMGFINNFVENTRARVIIVCNEDWVRNDWYALYREKVVGGSITVEPDPENALNGAVEHICVGDFAPMALIFQWLRPEILSVFRESGLSNLRLLHRLVVDSCRLYRAFTPEMRRDRAFLRLVITHMAAYSFALSQHSGDSKTYSEFVHQFFSNPGPLLAVHPWLKPVPPGGREFWIEFFVSGIINHDFEQFYNFLKKGEAAEPPLRLWSYAEMEDQEFKETVARLFDDLEAGRYQSPGLLLHAFSDLLFLASHGLIEMKVKDVLGYARKYLADFQFPRHSLHDGQDGDCSFEADCSHGMIFLAWDMPELETVKNLVREKLDNSDHAVAINALRRLVRELERHPETCRHEQIRALMNEGEEMLLFEAIEPMRIVELINQVPAGQRHLLFNHVLRNYRMSSENEPWLDAKNSKLLHNWINGFESGLKELCNNKHLSPLRCEIYDQMAHTAGKFKHPRK